MPRAEPVTALPTRQASTCYEKLRFGLPPMPERKGRSGRATHFLFLAPWKRGWPLSTPQCVRLFICPSPGESRSSEPRSGGTPAARSSSLPWASLATGRRPLCRAGRPSRDLGFLLVSPWELWLCFRPSAPAFSDLSSFGSRLCFDFKLALFGAFWGVVTSSGRHCPTPSPGGARQLVRNHEQTGTAAPSENGRLPPVLAHQLASVHGNSSSGECNPQRGAWSVSSPLRFHWPLTTGYSPLRLHSPLATCHPKHFRW